MKNILNEVIDIRQIRGKFCFWMPQAELLPGGSEATPHWVRRQVVSAGCTSLDE